MKKARYHKYTVKIPYPREQGIDIDSWIRETRKFLESCEASRKGFTVVRVSYLMERDHFVFFNISEKKEVKNVPTVQHQR